MKHDTGTVPASTSAATAPTASAAPSASASWTAQRERSSLWMLRLMRALALGAGRRLSRLVLHPICLYFFFFGGEARKQSRLYLKRALGREPAWQDGYRHVYTFAATVLDRVYLLQERFDEFEVEAHGVDCIVVPASRGEGILTCGAHLGSFEALRMIGHDKGLKVAMIMYEDNARLINETLAAIAPRAQLHTIALGRVDAMLSLHRWLESGGVAGMLADRTLPGAARSKGIVVPFLGAPARFPDGPFRLAAMLKRKVVFMAGLHRGGRRYDLRFEELADFSVPLAPGERDAAVRAAVERYAATLEHLCREAPYNWFNFFDFWADAENGTAPPGPNA